MAVGQLAGGRPDTLCAPASNGTSAYMKLTLTWSSHFKTPSTIYSDRIRQTPCSTEHTIIHDVQTYLILLRYVITSGA